jgi:hypothetical protein
MHGIINVWVDLAGILLIATGFLFAAILFKRAKPDPKRSAEAYRFYGKYLGGTPEQWRISYKLTYYLLLFASALFIVVAILRLLNILLG